jgi:hypothetical protein
MLPVRFTLSPRWGSMVECHCLMFDESSTMKFARAYSWQTSQVDMGQFLSNLLLLKNSLLQDRADREQGLRDDTEKRQP